MAQFTYQGLSTRTLAQIKEEIEGGLKSSLGENIDLSSTSLLGQMVSVFANAIVLEEEGLAKIYSNTDPSTATGDALERICAFNGVYRRGATNTSLTASLFFSSTGTYPSGTLLANPVGSDSDLFENVHTIVVPSVPYTASNVLMRAVQSGPVQVVLGTSGPGTLTQIASPVAGWDGLYGSASLIIGKEAESDEELRIRRITELFKPATTTVDGIVADLSTYVTGVITVAVYENTSSFVVNNIPPYAVEAVVWAPPASNENIARTIFNSISAGTPTHGNNSFDVPDSSGNLHTIRFSRPEEIGITITMDIVYRPGTLYPGDDGVKNVIIQNALKIWVPGLDASPSEIAHWVFDEVPGILAVENVTVNGTSTRFPISIRQIAVINSPADITINSTQGTP